MRKPSFKGATKAWTLGAGFAIVLGLAGLVPALDFALVRADPQNLSRQPLLLDYGAGRGALLYAAKCAGCHGADLQGDRRTGAARLTGPHWIYGRGALSDIERTVLYGIRSGHPKGRNFADMPAFATEHPYPRAPLPPLTPAEIRDVAEYVRQLKSAPRFDAAAAARGGQIYRGAGGCYDCHASDGGGDSFIGAPSLTQSEWLYGDGARDAIIATISHGRAGVCPAFIGKLSFADIRALAAYVYLRSHPAPRAETRPN